jgi:predicted O-methyltransferase YrrM
MSRSITSLIPSGLKSRVPERVKIRFRPSPVTETPNVRLAAWLKESTEYRDIGRPGPLITDVYEPSRSIPGWFTVDDAAHFALIMRYQTAVGVHGDVFEIGSYLGRSTALMASCLAADEKIVDTYAEKPTPEALVRNIRLVNLDLPDERIEIHACYSTELDFPPDRTFRFIHIDGGHSAERAEEDLVLCSRHLAPRGVMVLDDYENVWWPGVTEGANTFLAEHPNVRPIADLNRHGGDGRKLYLMDFGDE